MSENITHTAITDDCARLAIHSPDICAPFKLCFDQHLEIARLGGITRSGGTFVVPLLEQYRTVWAGRQAGDWLEEKLSFVLGWLCHRAADLQMKPIFGAANPDCPHSPTDCSVYHDVFVLREVYSSGQLEPYMPTTLKPEIEAIEDAFRRLWQRALLGMHTFIPDRGDVDGWLERVFKTRQQFTVDIRRYAQAFAHPDPDKTKRFITDVNFYDRDDALIRLARSIQNGQADASIDLARAIQAAATQSQYAQALRRSMIYVQAASDFFEIRIDEEAFKDKLERGKQGVS